MGGYPCVTIGVPVYNGEKHIAAMLDSLLSQDFLDYELIISDNASTDATPEICRAYVSCDRRIRYYRNAANIGAAGNYDRAFGLARGQYFKWAPHDDAYAPGYLRACVETLDRGGERVVLAAPRVLLIDDDGKVIREHDDLMDFREHDPVQRLAHLLSDPKSWCHALMGLMRTKVLRTTKLIGRYNGSDHTLLAELVLRGEFHEVPDRLYLRRVVDGQSPSLRANATPEDVVAWFDPSRRGRVVLPWTRLLAEHVRAIVRAPLTWRQKLACLRLLWTTPFAENWSAGWLVDEWRRGLRCYAWERPAFNTLCRSNGGYVPHRLWALFSGLKRRDLRRLALAVSPPSTSTHAALLEFVATNLSQRSDPRSRAVLEEWLAGQREDHRAAAVVAMQRRRHGATCSA